MSFNNPTPIFEMVPKLEREGMTHSPSELGTSRPILSAPAFPDEFGGIPHVCGKRIAPCSAEDGLVRRQQMCEGIDQPRFTLVIPLL